PVFAFVLGVEVRQLARRQTPDYAQERVKNDQWLALIALTVNLGWLSAPAREIELSVGTTAAAVLVQSKDPAGQFIPDENHAALALIQPLGQRLGRDVRDEYVLHRGLDRLLRERRVVLIAA